MVGWDVQFVARKSAFAGRVFDDEVFAFRGRLGARVDDDVAFHHLDEPSDSVGFVDDVLPRDESEWVDGGFAFGGESSRVFGNS